MTSSACSCGAPGMLVDALGRNREIVSRCSAYCLQHKQELCHPGPQMQPPQQKQHQQQQRPLPKQLRSGG